MKQGKSITILIAIILIFIFVLAISTMNCDREFHLTRLNELATEIKDNGILNYPYYINFEAYSNMGYATELFYGDIFLIIPAILINLGMNINMVYGITIFVSFILILESSNLAFKHFRKDKENAIYYSIIYTFSSFILFEVLERNALGTNFAYIFIPWVILSFINILSEERNKYDWVILGISMAGLILSHIQTSLIITMGLFIYAILNIKYIFKNPKVLFIIFGSILICLLLDAFFIFPIIEQMAFQRLYLIDKPLEQMHEAYINVLNVLLPNYIWNMKLPSSFIIGNNELTNNIQRTWKMPSFFIPEIMMIVISIISYIKEKKFDKTFIISVISIILAFTPILSYIKIMSFMQFPWRTITLMVVFLPITFSSSKKIGQELKYIVALLTIIIGIAYLLTLLVFFNEPFSYRETVSQGEYLPSEVPTKFFGYDYRTDIKVTNLKNGYMFNIPDEKMDEEIELPVLTYKGYKVYEVDENNNEYEHTNFEKGSNGLIVVKNAKMNNIKVIYEGTLLQKITKYISLIFCLILFTIMILYRYKNKV